MKEFNLNDGCKNENIPLITQSSQLMEHYEATKPIADRYISVAQDLNGDPIVFSITYDKQFNAVFRECGGKTGWLRSYLSSKIDGNPKVQTFSIRQNPNGEIYISLAIDSEGGSDLYISKPLSNNPHGNDWKNLENLWIKKFYANKKSIITEIFMGIYNERTDYPDIIIAAKNGDETKHYRINDSINSADLKENIYEIPQDFSSTLKMYMGNHCIYGRGVYFLGYLEDESLSLLFKPFDYDESIPLNVPENAYTLAAIPNDDGFTDLYIGGDGAHALMAQDQTSEADPIEIIKSGEINNIEYIIPCKDQNQISLWLIDKDKTLYQLGQDKTKGSWNTPIIFRKNVSNIAPFRNGKKETNEIIIADVISEEGASNLNYFYEEPTTKTIENNLIRIYDEKNLHTYDCYISIINFKDSSGSPIKEKSVLTASTHLEAEINGRTLFLGPNQPIEVETDYQGSITIINKVDTISTPTFHLIPKSVDVGPIDINPAQKIENELKNMDNADKLMAVRTKTGEPLIEGQNKDTVESTIKAVQQAFEMKEGFSKNTISDSSYCWGMKFGPEKSTFYGPELSDSWFENHLSTCRDNWFTDAFGRIFHTIAEKFVEVASVVVKKVNEVCTIIWEIGKKAVATIIKTAEQVSKFVSWLLEKIKIGIKKFKDWLGYIFDWDAIIKTHNVFSNMTDQFLCFTVDRISLFESNLCRYLDEIDLDSIKSTQLGNLGNISPKSKQKELESETSTQKAKEFINSPEGNWANYQLLHANMLDVNSNPCDIEFYDEGVMEDLQKILKNLEPIKNDAQKIGEDIIEAFENGSNIETINNLIFDVIKTFIDTAKSIIKIIFDIIKAIIQWIHDAIKQTIEIPFLSSLYEAKVHEPLTPLNAAMLLASIILTPIYKMAFQKAPFDDTLGLDTDNYSAILRKLGWEDESDLDSIAVDSNFGIIYSNTGGVIYSIANISYGFIKLVEFYNYAPSTPASVFKVISHIKGCLGVLSFAFTCPVKDGKGIEYDIVRWFSSIIKTILEWIGSFKIEESETRNLTLGMMDILFCIQDIPFFILSFIEEAKGEADWGKFINNILNIIVKISSGITRIITDPATKLIPAALFAGLNFGAAMINLARVITNNYKCYHQNYQ